MNKPSLLFFSYFYPPAYAVASTRSWNISKHLLNAGWTVNVVTPIQSLWKYPDHFHNNDDLLKHNNFKITSTNHYLKILSPEYLQCNNSRINFFLGGIGRVFLRSLGYEPQVGWIPALYYATSNINATDADLILATGPPFCTFLFTKYFSDKIKIPYVLDYRDLWTHGNPHNEVQYFDFLSKQEERILSECSGIITVSNGLANILSDKFNVGHKISVITNGYDADLLDVIEKQCFDHFSIVYTGIFYPPKRSIEPFMKALKLLNNELPMAINWKFHYYGPQNNHVKYYANKEGILHRVVLHGHVKKSEAIAATKGADLALVITSTEDNANKYDDGILTGKIFEALGVCTPILLIAPKGSEATSIIGENDEHFIASDASGIKEYIKTHIYSKSTRLKIRADNYSWAKLINKYDKMLRNVIHGHFPLDGSEI